MGHVIFIILHLIAIFFTGFLLLFITIPAHLIYAAASSGSKPMRDPNAPRPDTHVHCPDCRELILKDARVCKHCGCKLIPQT